MNLKNVLDLSGDWEFRLDPNESGIDEGWLTTGLEGQVRLPGSLDENGIGEENTDPSDLSGLSRPFRYVGPAWYSRQIELPKDWEGKSLELVLERVHWFSDVWVNGVWTGANDSLSTEHHYRLPLLPADQLARITIRIDNTPRIPIGRIGHALTDWTQTNWNGVIGQISLRVVESPLEALQVTTNGQFLTITGTTQRTGKLTVSLSDEGTNLDASFEVQSGMPFVEQVNIEALNEWSDQQPSLFTASLELGGFRRDFLLGRRSIRCSDKQILFNERPLFLRGTLECCVFPKTGYPPTNVAEWQTIMEKVREYGLNHLRFHSWCPPEAAFVAADQLGVLLQVELPVWTGLWPISSDEALLNFCEREAHRILRAFGHHPSFVLFALGNEIAFYGEEPAVDELLTMLKQAYPNRLYTFSAQGTHLSPACDFYVQADNGKPGSDNRPLRGSTWFGVGSRFDREIPNTLVTCNEASEQFDRPVISHEVAEWAVFPDVQNESRYDGVLEARNFRTIAQMLERRGMLHQAADFVFASGKLSAKLYKEEIETLLRTRGLSGYQLLGLTDFPGQGTATIGMLDAFWQEKGFINAREFREFCGETVPLLQYEKVIWNSAEEYSANALLFHSGDLKREALEWRVWDNERNLVAMGALHEQTLTAGSATAFGKIQFKLESFNAPGHFELELTSQSGAMNHWPFWVFPNELPNIKLVNVLEAPFYRQDVRDALKAGSTVWLKMNPRRLWSGIPGRFAPAFWSPIHFKEQVGTMGSLIEANHPLFKEFPTDQHTDWQWWDVLMNSKAMVLNELPLDFKPLLQVIDRYERNDKLGTMFEARVGDGRVLVTLIDFNDLESRPATRQLEYSIKTYLSSSVFEPTQRLSLADLDRAFAREP